jgi:hypothetical protein
MLYRERLFEVDISTLEAALRSPWVSRFVSLSHNEIGGPQRQTRKASALDGRMTEFFILSTSFALPSSCLDSPRILFLIIFSRNAGGNECFKGSEVVSPHIPVERRVFHFPQQTPRRSLGRRVRLSPARRAKELTCQEFKAPKCARFSDFGFSWKDPM